MHTPDLLLGCPVIDIDRQRGVTSVVSPFDPICSVTGAVGLPVRENVTVPVPLGVTLMAARFDADCERITGPPVTTDTVQPLPQSVASVATINARAKIGEAMIGSSERSYQVDSGAEAFQLVALPGALNVRWLREGKEGAEEQNWLAIALRVTGETGEYLLVKGTENHWAKMSAVRLET